MNSNQRHRIDTRRVEDRPQLVVLHLAGADFAVPASSFIESHQLRICHCATINQDFCPSIYAGHFKFGHALF
ncbi:hypothetical protein D2V07_16675 [Aurantiacibacter zhengii]|uniref:Uncharacterized protein n=1 Tax=Aurantiacibacter zhengii TaxID=2307003 RepID=A0A418NNG9_9SPHN|nr:hypothetical protein D2V07_16675 [Aurantiacibacter zhengii]